MPQSFTNLQINTKKNPFLNSLKLSALAPLRVKTFLLNRQGKGKGAAFADFARYPDFAAVHFDEFLCQR